MKKKKSVLQLNTIIVYNLSILPILTSYVVNNPYLAIGWLIMYQGISVGFPNIF